MCQKVAMECVTIKITLRKSYELIDEICKIKTWSLHCANLVFEGQGVNFCPLWVPGIVSKENISTYHINLPASNLDA